MVLYRSLHWSANVPAVLHFEMYQLNMAGWLAAKAGLARLATMFVLYLDCLFVSLLACWLAGLLACWLAGLLACWLPSSPRLALSCLPSSHCVSVRLCVRASVRPSVLACVRSCVGGWCVRAWVVGCDCLAGGGRVGFTYKGFHQNITQDFHHAGRPFKKLKVKAVEGPTKRHLFPTPTELWPLSARMEALFPFPGGTPLAISAFRKAKLWVGSSKIREHDLSNCGDWVSFLRVPLKLLVLIWLSL